MLVRKRCLEEGHVHPLETAPEEARHLGEINRRVVGKPCIDGPAGAVADEEGIVPEIGLEFLVGIGGHPEGPDVQNLRVEEGLGVFLDVTDHGVDEVLGLGTGRGDEDRIPPVDVVEDGFFGRKFRRVALPPDIENMDIIFHGLVSLSALFRLCIRLNGGGKAVKTGNRRELTRPLFCLDSLQGKLYIAKVL